MKYRRLDVRVPFTRIQLHASVYRGWSFHFAITRMPHIIGFMVVFSFIGWDWGPFRWRSMHEFHLGPITLSYCEWNKTFGHVFNTNPSSDNHDDNSRTDREQPSDQPGSSNSDRAEHQEPA